MPETNGASNKTPQHVTKGSDWDANAGTLTITWADEQKTVLSAAELPQAIRNDLMYHGLLSRVQQAYVAAKGSPSVARDKAAKCWDSLKGGDWGLSRGERSYSITVQALSALMSISLEDADKRFDVLSKQRKIEVGKRPDVRQKIAELRAAEASGKPQGDLAAMLG